MKKFLLNNLAESFYGNVKNNTSCKVINIELGISPFKDTAMYREDLYGLRITCLVDNVKRVLHPPPLSKEFVEKIGEKNLVKDLEFEIEKVLKKHGK